MKEERKNAEKRFWQTLAQVVAESGKGFEWEYLGYTCSKRKIDELIQKFHQNTDQPGFFGIKVGLAIHGGLRVNLLIENQRELIFGIQLGHCEECGAESYQAFGDLLGNLASSGRGWNLDSPGWLAWKTPEVRLNFRAVGNKAFQDLLRNGENSEALYLICEELQDLLEELSENFVNQTVAEYGTIIG